MRLRKSGLRGLAPAVALLALAACAGLPGSGRVFGPAGPGPAPIADRPIEIAGDCSQTEDDGFRENARLTVRANQVEALSWRLWVGKRGSCAFDLAEFRQTKSHPTIELTARDGSGCRLFVYQDPRRVTLAHAGCQRRCSGGIYEEAWPVMFDPQTGRCARTG